MAVRDYPLRRTAHKWLQQPGVSWSPLAQLEQRRQDAHDPLRELLLLRGHREDDFLPRVTYVLFALPEIWQTVKKPDVPSRPLWMWPPPPQPYLRSPAGKGARFWQLLFSMRHLRFILCAAVISPAKLIVLFLNFSVARGSVPSCPGQQFK